MSKVLKTGLSASIAAQLRQEILSGEREAGSPLRQEHIAQAFGASHVPVREALQILQAEGLAISVPRRGSMVAPMNLEDAREITEMRAELEALALRRAIPALGAEEIADAERAIRAGYESQDLTVWAEANWNFHRALYRQAKAPRLLESIEHLWLHAERYIRMVWNKLDYQDKAQHEHAEILRLAKEGRSDEAQGLLKEHILAAGRAMEALLPRAAQD